jgi:hypothetical protein
MIVFDKNQWQLSGDLTIEKIPAIIDLIIVGSIDKIYLQTLIEKVEVTINKKIRVSVYKKEEFTEDIFKSVSHWVDLLH